MKNTYLVPPVLVPNEIPDDLTDVKTMCNPIGFRSIDISEHSRVLLLVKQSHMLVWDVYNKIYRQIMKHSVVLGQPQIGLCLNYSAGSLLLPITLQAKCFPLVMSLPANFFNESQLCIRQMKQKFTFSQKMDGSVSMVQKNSCAVHMDWRPGI